MLKKNRFTTKTLNSIHTQPNAIKHYVQSSERKKDIICHIDLKFRTQEHPFVDGIDVDKLSEGELYGFLDAEDEKFIGQLG